jgi:hypothetical protein
MDNGSTAQRNTSFYIQRTIGLLLLLALSATFFYSAYTKSGVLISHFHLLANDNAFDSFQWSFLDLGISSITFAGIIARLMIGFELLLGLFLLFHIRLRPFTYNAVIAVLSVFIIYLLIIIFKQGNTGNCGCFGDQLQMTPMQAIWKNVAMIIVTIILKNIYPADPYRINPNIFVVIVSVLVLLAFCPPFIFNKVFMGTNPEAVNKPINLDPLYKYSTVPDVDLRKGKHIIAFMSLTCPHCKKAAYLLHLIHNEHPDIPLYIVLDGADTFRHQFFDETHAQDVPNLYFHHSVDFMGMAGTSVPSILWVDNSMVAYKSVYAYYQLDPKFMEQWLHK